MSSNFSQHSVPIRRRFPQFSWFNDTGIPESCSVPEVVPVDGNRFIVPINGGLVPSFFFVTIVTNSLICAVLLRKNMRTSTNTLQVAMAVSDTLTGIWSVPFFIHLYTLGGYANPLGYRWCRLYYWMTDYLPTVFHTASVWLTVALATERYIQVRHMLLARNVCTIRNMIRVIVIIYVAAILVHLVRFFELQVFPLPVSRSVLRAQRGLSTFQVVVKTTTCCFDYNPPFSDNIELYFNVYFWCRVILVNVIPCVSLTLLSALLACAICKARILRSRLVRQHRMMEYQRLGEANATTLMLLVVVSVFLVVEVPTGINLITLIVENNSGQAHVERWTRSLLELVTNMLIVISYPLNFLIYCAMSRQFRQTFRTMFVAGCLRGRSTSTRNAGQGSGSTAAGCGTLCPPSTVVHDEVRAGNTPSASNVVNVRLEVNGDEIVLGIVSSRTIVLVASIEADLAVEDVDADGGGQTVYA